MSRSMSRYSVVVIDRPADWLPANLGDRPIAVKILDTLLPVVKHGLAKRVVKAYNLNPPAGRWAAVQVLPQSAS